MNPFLMFLFISESLLFKNDFMKHYFFSFNGCLKHIHMPIKPRINEKNVRIYVTHRGNNRHDIFNHIKHKNL